MAKKIKKKAEDPKVCDHKSAYKVGFRNKDIADIMVCPDCETLFITVKSQQDTQQGR